MATAVGSAGRLANPMLAAGDAALDVQARRNNNPLPVFAASDQAHLHHQNFFEKTPMLRSLVMHWLSHSFTESSSGKKSPDTLKMEGLIWLDVDMVIQLRIVSKAFRDALKGRPDGLLPAGFKMSEAYVVKHVPLRVIAHFALPNKEFDNNQLEMRANQGLIDAHKAALLVITPKIPRAQRMIDDNSYRNGRSELARQLLEAEHPQTVVAAFRTEKTRLENELHEARQRRDRLSGTRESLMPARCVEGLKHLMSLPRRTHPRDATDLALRNYHVTTSLETLRGPGDPRNQGMLWAFLERGTRDHTTTTSLREGITLAIVNPGHQSNEVMRYAFQRRTIGFLYKELVSLYYPNRLNPFFITPDTFGTRGLTDIIATTKKTIATQKKPGHQPEYRALIEDDLQTLQKDLAEDQARVGRYDPAFDPVQLAERVRRTELEIAKQIAKQREFLAQDTPVALQGAAQNALRTQEQGLANGLRLLAEREEGFATHLTLQGVTGQWVAERVLNHPKKDDVLYEEPSCWVECLNGLKTALLIFVGAIAIAFDYLCKATTDLVQAVIEG